MHTACRIQARDQISDSSEILGPPHVFGRDDSAERFAEVYLARWQFTAVAGLEHESQSGAVLVGDTVGRGHYPCGRAVQSRRRRGLLRHEHVHVHDIGESVDDVVAELVREASLAVVGGRRDGALEKALDVLTVSGDVVSGCDLERSLTADRNRQLAEEVAFTHAALAEVGLFDAQRDGFCESTNQESHSWDLRSPSVRDAEDVVSGLCYLLDFLGVLEDVSAHFVSVDDGYRIRMLSSLVEVEEKVTPAAEATTRKVDRVTVISLSLIFERVRNIEVLVGISEVADHLLAELADGLFAFFFALAFSELFQLFGQSCSTIRKAETAARARPEVPILADDPADLRRPASQIHDEPLHLHETACDSECADVTFFFLLKQLDIESCGGFDGAE